MRNTIKQLASRLPNLTFEEGEINLSNENKSQYVLVIKESDYIPNTLKVAQAIAIGMPIVPFEWINELQKMKVNDLLKDGGWSFQRFVKRDIKPCRNLFSDFDLVLLNSLSTE